jgi:hypothetical protein
MIVGITQNDIQVFPENDYSQETIYPDNRIQEFIISDEYYCYAMCDPSKKKAATSGVQQDADPGLYIYDLISLTSGE